MRGRPLTVAAEPAFRTGHANPYNYRLYTAIRAQGVPVRELRYLDLLLAPPSVVHLHWPDLTFLSGPRRWRHVVRLVSFFGLLRVARLRGTRLVWTVHNLEAHEERSSRPIRAMCRRLLLRNVDAFLSLSGEGVTATRAAYPELVAVPGFVTPHGHYRLDYDLTGDRDEARRTLGLPEHARVLVSVGAIRPYKNVPTLIHRFRERKDDGTILAVAGRPASAPLRREIEEAAGGDPRIWLELAFLPPERIALWLRAADLVVLPYRAIENSGSAVLALSAQRPILVPALGAMAELAGQFGAEWVHLYHDEITSATLDEALQWLHAGVRPVGPDLSPLEWDGIAERTIEVYREVVSGARPDSSPHPRC